MVVTDISRFLRRIRPGLHNERGAVGVHVGLIAIVLIGFGALGIEAGYLLLKHREMQSAADGAAMSAATALSYGFPADFRLEGKAVAAKSGFTDGVDGTTVTINSPPTMGANAGNAKAVEAIISQPQTLTLMRLFRSGLFDVGAHAVAVTRPGYRYCMLSLDPSADEALFIKNNVVVSNPNCGVAVDSSSASALRMRNNASINGPTYVHGSWDLDNNAQLNGAPNINNGPVIDDPYADVALEPIPACTAQSGTASNGVTVSLNPGNFCSGFNFQNNVTVNLQPGAYYIDTEFVAKNNVVINGTGGVTLIITGSYALDWGNGLTINLVAPTTGTYAGIALFGPRDGPTDVVQDIDNNTQTDIQGAIYFPSQILSIHNNGITGSAQCTQIIARVIQIYNNAYVNNDCDGTGVRPFGPGLSELVE